MLRSCASFAPSNVHRPRSGPSWPAPTPVPWPKKGRLPRFWWVKCWPRTRQGCHDRVARFEYPRATENGDLLMSNPQSSLPDGALAQDVPSQFDAASPERFVNRELSWLGFNRRVLEESRNRRHPLLERMRFLSISASNLDEFFMVRIAGLKGMVSAGVNTLSDDGLTPAQQLVQVDRMASELIADQQGVWTALCRELREAGIAVIEPEDVMDSDRAWLDAHFREQVFPVLTPLAI